MRACRLRVGMSGTHNNTGKKRNAQQLNAQLNVAEVLEKHVI